ncbi:MAG: LysR family transcriptional regulator [Flavobacteriaceae bacterium]
MHYTLHQLQVFLTIAEHKSITKAAEAMHLTQPAVSIQLKNLQQQFAIPLTEVVGRKLYITDFGREIEQAAEKILNEVHAINYRSLSYRGLLAGRLNISVVSTGKYVMPYFLSDFMTQHPGIELSMDVTNKTYVVENLARNELDFAMVSVLPKNLEIDTVSLMENKLYFVASTRLDMDKKNYEKKLLKEFPLIYRESGSATRNAMEAYISHKRLSVRKKLELTSNEAVKQAVVAGLGCSIMPLIGIKNELRSGELHIIPMKGLPISTRWRLVWLKAKKLSPVAKAFLEFIAQKKEEIIHENFDWISEY